MTERTLSKCSLSGYATHCFAVLCLPHCLFDRSLDLYLPTYIHSTEVSHYKFLVQFLLLEKRVAIESVCCISKHEYTK